MIRVNLLPYKQRRFLLRQRLAWFVTSGSLIVGIGYAVVLLGLLTWGVVVQRQFKASEQQTDGVKAELAGLAGTESQLVLVKTKLSRIAELERQSGVAAVLPSLQGLLGTAVEWREVAVKPDGLIEVTAASRDVVAMGETLERLETSQVNDFREIKLTSLTKGSNGEYSLTLQLQR